ncbi:MAG: prepilin-type N-terminal cleavage/methylation domain-containing protein [Candidatus Binatia bacterium]
MNSDGRAGERGFTLIETVVSLGLFAVATAAIGGLLLSQIRMETSNTAKTTAISLAAKELEDLRALDYPSIPASRASTATVGGLTYTVSSAAVFDTPAAGMASITTTVSWTEPLGSQTYVLNAVYTDVTR